ncbi:MAG: cytochrome c oxidase subunit [Paenibacillaceae bacterium]|jgi:cytochrome c oxidase subunit 2|nr:cytochrome c oxidase subunit [Paenibacillaceae bacterium]
MKKLWICTGLIALILGLSACGTQTGDSAAATTASPGVKDPANAQKVTIVAANWKFDKAEYRVKKGQPVSLTLKNEQGVHGLEVEKLNVKLDNKTKTKVFTPDKAGRYNIVCTIPCGTDHLKMKAVLVVED